MKPERFREYMTELGYSAEQITEMEREAREWAKTVTARGREVDPDNHLCGFITPWGATHKMVKTESGEWTAVRSEPVNAEDRPKIDRWLAQHAKHLAHTAQDKK